MNLSFYPPNLSLSPEFWQTLYSLKLNQFKLDDDDKFLRFFYNANDGFSLTKDSISNQEPKTQQFVVPGVLKNVNTINDFQTIDKKSLIESKARLINDAIHYGTAIRDPSILFSFILLTFADLKSYRFTYWFGAPVLVPSIPFQTAKNSPVSLFKIEHTKAVVSIYHQLHIYLNNAESLSTKMIFMLVPSNNQSAGDGSYSLIPLSQGWSSRYDKHSFIVVLDTDTLLRNKHSEASSTTPTAPSAVFGWSMRNLLALVSLHHVPSDECSSCNIVSLRGSLLNRLLSFSDVATTQQFLDNSDDNNFYLSPDYFNRYPTPLSAADGTATAVSVLPRVVGWELNEKGKPGPRVANMAATLDSRTMIGQSVDLNVSLMKWRLWPTLDTQRLSTARVLLIGAGTLGCAVARTLLGWGIRTITLVDNGIVSYSNPSRQCLFEYEDCVQRKPKAQAACDSLKRIFPDLTVRAVNMTIPMPGHPFSSSSTTPSSSSSSSSQLSSHDEQLLSEEEQNVLELDSLISSHDVVFTLTDSRESRWLPTVICQAHRKLLINVALGFDSYLVMRHGVTTAESTDINTATINNGTSNASTTALGCYFCSDVVAAMNSQRDRTLDQQCTVTRPGLSFIAAGLAVEMMVALLQSPLGPLHPAVDHTRGTNNTASSSSSSGSSVGVNHNASEDETDEEIIPIPHQIRGSLAQFRQFDVTTPAFACCTACSRPVVQEYVRRSSSFVKEACGDSSNGKYLETLSGVTALMSSVNLDDCCFDDGDDDYDDD